MGYQSTDWVQNIEIFRTCSNMASQSNMGDVQSFPSLLSASILNDDISIKNDLSFKFNNEDQLVNIDFGSFTEIKGDEPSRVNTSLPQLQLRRCTSFEEMLMENHRHVLFDSIREYFQKINHTFLKSVKSLKQFADTVSLNKTEETIAETQLIIETLLSQNLEISELLHNQIMDRLRENPDEMNIVADMLKISPQKIQFQVLFLICCIFKDCDEIIQHFKRRNLARELKHRSIKLARQLIKLPCLKYLFQGQKEGTVSTNFEVLVQKWAITLFLMKVGVFENELETKSIDDCLKSQIFSKIDLNDLLNQHLIRPSKKVHHDK